MLRHSLIAGLAVAAISLGLGDRAEAAMANLSAKADVAPKSGVTDVRWVCGPYRCAYIQGYAGPVVVRPYMRGWGPPPSPHCHYVRGPYRWALVCP